MFVDHLLLVDVFSELYLCQNTTMSDLLLWKIDNVDLTRQFSLSIFTDFRYKSIKITWLLSIFNDTDFYRLTTPGINQTQ